MIVPILVGGLAFVAMEGVSYSLHRWLMHGMGMGWHRSHHAPPVGRLELNDLFPVCFAAMGVGLYAGGSATGNAIVLSVASAVSAYGAAYLAVHEIYIHRRVRWQLPGNRYLDWLQEAHRVHHRTGGEPYGMLLPLVRCARAAPVGRVPIERSMTRRARSRL